MIRGKKAQGLSTNAIVLIVLAVVVLVILIVGFTLGWSKFAPWLGSDNVDDVVQQCNVACSIEKTYDYCTRPRTVKVKGEDDIEGTCKELATDQKALGFTACSITCPSEDVPAATGEDALDEAGAKLLCVDVGEKISYQDEAKNTKEWDCVWEDLAETKEQTKARCPGKTLGFLVKYRGEKVKPAFEEEPCGSEDIKEDGV